MSSEVWIRGTAWASLALWSGSEWVSSRRTSVDRGSIVAWRLNALGASVFVLHVFLAMQIRHGWSHTAAVQETARQTEVLFGIRDGSGVWLNYLMALLWMADVWRSRSPVSVEARSSRRWLKGFLFFMWFNAAIVFPRGAWRLMGVALLLLVIASWWTTRTASARIPR
jgi:hypothetical protein